MRASRRSSWRVRMLYGHLVDHLGGVTAGVALQEGDERDLLEVAALHARHARAERVLERNAEPLVGDDASELLV